MELISRRGALQAIAKLKSDYDCDYNTIVGKCYDAVKKLPVHSEDRKTGKWNLTEIHNCYDVYQCDKCNRIITVFHGYGYLPTKAQIAEDYPYCHCGAKMEVDDD